MNEEKNIPYNKNATNNEIRKVLLRNHHNTD